MRLKEAKQRPLTKDDTTNHSLKQGYPIDSEAGKESAARNPGIESFFKKTTEPNPVHPNPPSMLGKCLESQHPELSHLCLVEYEDSESNKYQQWLQHIDGLNLEKDDPLLLLWPYGSNAPIVVGKLSRPEPTRSISLPTGHKLVFQHYSDNDNPSAIALELPDGQKALEIDLEKSVPTIRLMQKDLLLDLEGRLKIAARSIDLVAKLGNVNVKANDDYKVTAERIWLN